MIRMMLVFVVALSGCEFVPTAEQEMYKSTVGVTTCTNYPVTEEVARQSQVVDSTRACPGGAAPFLLRVSWRSTDPDCPMDPKTAVGKAVRTFACPIVPPEPLPSI